MAFPPPRWKTGQGLGHEWRLQQPGQPPVREIDERLVPEPPDRRRDAAAHGECRHRHRVAQERAEAAHLQRRIVAFMDLRKAHRL